MLSTCTSKTKLRLPAGVPNRCAVAMWEGCCVFGCPPQFMCQRLSPRAALVSRGGTFKSLVGGPSSGVGGGGQGVGGACPWEGLL